MGILKGFSEFIIIDVLKKVKTGESLSEFEERTLRNAQTFLEYAREFTKGVHVQNEYITGSEVFSLYMQSNPIHGTLKEAEVHLTRQIDNFVEIVKSKEKVEDKIYDEVYLIFDNLLKYEQEKERRKDREFYRGLRDSYLESAKEDEYYAELFAGVSYEADQLMIQKSKEEK